MSVWKADLLREFVEEDAKEPFNKNLVQIIANGVREAGAEVAVIDLKARWRVSSAHRSDALGGLRGLVNLRAISGNIGVRVLPDQIAVPKAHEAFDGDGVLERHQATGERAEHG